MKKYLLIIVIAYASGLLGAFTFHYLIPMPELSKGEKWSEPALMIRNEQPDQSVNYRNNPPLSTAGTGMDNIDMLNGAFAEASENSTQSVVYIKTLTERRYANTWYEWFFGDRTGRSFISTGSGVIYTRDGYIVTNNHVIENADVIEVIHNKRTYQAELVGTDPSTDIAVLKIDASNLPTIPTGSARGLKVGEWVLAVGNPFNLTSTVTAGIVSAKGRQINILKTNFPIESFIQTDAAINPGNSGGALVNVKGELVGINTAILSKTGSYAGYGFAVPVDIVSKVVEDFIKYGEVQKAYFGAEIIDIDQELGEKLKLKNWNGVIIQDIQEDGAADKAGLREGDIIIGLNNEDIRSKSEFEEIISYHSPGDRLDITFKRNNNVKNTSITLTNAQGTTSIIKRDIYSSKSLGADFEVVPKVERELLNIPHGVRVTSIRSGLINKLNIEEGFIITYINKIPIKDPEKLVDVLTRIRGRVYIEGVTKDGVKGYYSYFF